MRLNGKSGDEFDSKSSYARHRGVSRQRIQAYAKSGKLKTLHGGKIDRKASDARIAASRIAPSSRSRARAIFEDYRARLAKLEYELKVGKVVEAEAVKKAAFASARMVRDALLNLPDRLAPLLAAESDLHRVHGLLLGEIRICLTSLNGHGHGA